MKVTIEFDLRELDIAQRCLLRELFHDQDVRDLEDELDRIKPFSEMPPDEPELPLGKPESQKSPTIVDKPAKTEIVGDSKLEGFVPPKRGRGGAKPKTDAVEAATTSAMEQRHAAERIEPPPLDPAAIGGDDDFVAVPVVTDKDMHNACAAKMAKRQSETISNDIRALIGTYVQAGQGVAMIPQSARAGFLDKLAAL